MSVEDQGVGFDLASVQKAGRAMGLASMRESAQILGESLDITSCKGEWTKVAVRIPRAKVGQDNDQDECSHS